MNQQWGDMATDQWRFSKFYVRKLFDGEPHLVQRDQDYPGFLADDDVIHRLRQAAYHRGTSFIVTRCPEGFWVQSRANLLSDTEVQQSGLREQLAIALGRIARLEEELRLLRNE